MSPDKQLVIWRLALASLQDDRPAVLLYVLDSRGSSPGRQGFFMVVNADGMIEGSIGGGIMEHKFTEMARAQLAHNDHTTSVRRQIHDKDAAKDRSGMICSGEQTILLYTLRPNDIPPITALLASMSAYQNGTIHLSPAGIAFSPESPSVNFRLHIRTEADWVYEERTGCKNYLTIIGGGHCSLALSRIMRTMDFYIIVVEHRPELPTLLCNDYAHEKIIVEDYDELREKIPAGPTHHFVVVMTLGYRTDDRAARALMDKPFRYLGLLGSKAKVGQLFAEYRTEGLREEQLQKIHTPAGLSINSQTPEEIAVSIAAEIIREKNTPC